MSKVKQVKIDNWGIYFLQRFKHFFNRTDYCDLTLQFQDNAKLKVHRLVLNVCTEYFKFLERTCEWYDDCLVMPDNLQADVVVPIVNFMYTGQLEFKKESLDKLYQTSQIMDIPVLTKLLETHGCNQPKMAPNQSYEGFKKKKKVTSIDTMKPIQSTPYMPSSSGKRSFNKAFENNKTLSEPKILNSKSSVFYNTFSEMTTNKFLARSKPFSEENTSLSPHIYFDSELYSQKYALVDSHQIKYKLPEELNSDDISEDSLLNASQPSIFDLDSNKHYSSKINSLYNEISTPIKNIRGSSTADTVECKNIAKNAYCFDIDSVEAIHDDGKIQPAYITVRDEPNRDSQVFDQMVDNSDSPKLTSEDKNEVSENLDPVKIISEVLKQYPHLVKGIKLNALNTSSQVKKPRLHTTETEKKFDIHSSSEICYGYETDIIHPKKTAKLIAMGAGNTKGPWICLTCATPGKALNFASYYNFHRHLVDVHNEKLVPTLCKYCGLRSYNRNQLLHHIYSIHGVPPPPQYNFPKCNICDYIALNESFLVKHKLTHSGSKPLRCHVCFYAFRSAAQLVLHIQKTGHKVQKIKKNKKKLAI